MSMIRWPAVLAGFVVAAVLGTRHTGRTTPGHYKMSPFVERTIVSTRPRDGFCVVEMTISNRGRRVFDETLAFLAPHCEVDSNQDDRALDAEALARRLADKDGVMCALTDRIDEKLLARCPKLKAVANIAVGYNNIDLAACTARGIMATNTPGVLDDSTADFTWALLLAAARRVVEGDRLVREGKWKGWDLMLLLGADVHGKTLGIFGLGRIGRKVAERARGFGTRVLDKVAFAWGS